MKFAPLLRSVDSSSLLILPLAASESPANIESGRIAGDGVLFVEIIN